MSFFFLFFFLLFCWLVLWPAIKFAWRVKNARRNYTDAFNSMFGHAASNGSSAPEPPARKAKKIGKDVGEYVAVEEITDVEQRTHPDGTVETEVYHEERITDIEWEDIKDDTISKQQ